MNNRTLTTLILAALLAILVMIVGVVMTFSGSTNVAKYGYQVNLAFAYANAQSMKIIDLTGDSANDLFIQPPDQVVILDSSGNPLYSKQFRTPLATTMGDVDLDGVEDVVVFEPGKLTIVRKAQSEQVFALDSSLLGDPSRVIVMRFGSQVQLVLGDTLGFLAAYDNQGNLLWNQQELTGEYIRGLDNALSNRNPVMVAGNYNGRVMALDAEGGALWSYDLGQNLRRLRAYDLNGDGNSEVILGGENGALLYLDASNGAVLVNENLGQRVTEIRDIELDGDPGQREIVIGGRDGGVWGYHADGSRIFSRSVGARVNEVFGIDVDKDGKEEVILGDDNGRVAILSTNQGAQTLLETGSTISRIDIGRLTSGGQVAVGDGSQVQVLQVNVEKPAALRFLPLLVSLVISGLIAVVAWFIATMPARPELRATLQDGTPEGLQAQRRMLKETIADVERLRGSDQIESEAYLARLKGLRQQLADNEVALKTAGVKLTPETFNCPNCGGTLLLGQDKCDYCGQVVLT